MLSKKLGRSGRMKSWYIFGTRVNTMPQVIDRDGMKLVREGGFEPPSLAAPPPQDGVSASSTTPAAAMIIDLELPAVSSRSVLESPFVPRSDLGLEARPV